MERDTQEQCAMFDEYLIETAELEDRARVHDAY